MGILDTIKGLGTSVVNMGKYLVSEFVTNKDMSKGILDFDKYQEYEKMLNAPGLEAADASDISKKMVAENIIDPWLYDNATKKAAEQAAKQTTSEVDKQTGQYVSDFRNNMTADITENYKKGDKYQRDVIQKAVDELTSQYQMTADNVGKTLEDTKSPELQKQWDELRPEYETLIRDSAKKYAQYINEGLSFNQAYDKLIKEGKDKANRIVQIQNKLSNAMYWNAGIKGNIAEANAHFKGEGNRSGLIGLRDEVTNVPKGIFDLGKALMNVVGGGLQLVGQGIEEGKQAVGQYDVLEELDNMNIYRDSGPVIDKRRTLKSRGYEIVDGLPTLAPSIAAFIVGNKASAVLKLDEVMTAMVGGGKLIEGAASVSKVGKFLASNMEDLLLMDMVAQPMIGRPITTQDFKENWMFNIPINGALASIVRSSKLVGALPEGAITSKFISPNVLSLITDGAKSDDDIIKYTFAEKKAIGNTTINNIVNDMETIEGMAPANKLKLNPVTDGMKDTIDISTLPQHIQDRVNVILQGLAKHNEDVKLGKTTVTDSLLNQTLDKTIKTNGGTLGTKSGEEINIPNETFKRVDDLKEGIERKTPQRLVRAKLQQSGLVNLYRSGFISKDQLIPIIESTKDGMGKDMLKAMWSGDKEAQKRILASMNSITDSKAFIASIEQTYGDVIGKVVSQGEKNGLLKPGAQIGNYRFIGNGKRWDILTGTELTKEDLLTPVSYVKNKDIIVNTSLVARSDYFNYAVPSLLEKALKDPYLNTINVSGVFKLYDSPEILRKLDTYQGVKTWLGNQFKVLNIKFETGTADTMLKSLTSSDANGAHLLDIANELQKKGFNVTELTKKELALYKLVHIKEYVDAMTTSELKSGDFKARFEKLYKDDGGVLKLDIEKHNISNADTKELAARSADNDFNGIEIKSAQIITKEQLKQISLFDNAGKEFTIETPYKAVAISKQIMTLLEDIKDTQIYSVMKDAIEGAVAHISLTGKEKATFIQGYAQAIGGLLGDRKSRAYLTKLFMGSTEQFKIDIIQSFIARSFSRDTKLRSAALRNMIDKLSVIKKTENLSQYRGLVELISSLEFMDKNMLYISPSLKAGFTFQFDKLFTSEIKKASNIINPAKFNFKRIQLNKLAIARKIKEGGTIDLVNMLDKEAVRMSDKSIREIADIITYNTLYKYGISNEGPVKSMSDGLFNIIKDFQYRADKYIDVVGGEEIGGKASIGFKEPLSIQRGEDFMNLNLGELSELRVLGMLSDPEQRFKHLSVHEMAHVEQHLGGKNIFNTYEEVLNRLKGQVKELRKRTDDSFFGHEYYKGVSEYFNDFSAIKLTTGLAQERVAVALDKIATAIKDKTFIINDFQTELQLIYKTYMGVDTTSLMAIKETLAEAISQLDTYYKIGLSKQEFNSVGKLFQNAQKLLDDISILVNDIGKKYTPTQIQDIIGFKPPVLEDAISGQSILTSPVIYNDTLSNTANTGFLGEHFTKLVKGQVYDDAIVKWNTIFDKARKVYEGRDIPKTISMNGLRRILKKSIGGYSKAFTDAMTVLLGKKGLVFDIRDLFITEADIKDFQTIYKSQYKYLDEYILNKIVANAMAGKAEYDEAAMDYLNKAIFNDKFNFELTNLRNNESVFTRAFISALNTVGENTEGYTVWNIKKAIGSDEKYKQLMTSMNNYMAELYHTMEPDQTVIDKARKGLKKQLKPIILELFDRDIAMVKGGIFEDDLNAIHKDASGKILTDIGGLTPDEYFDMHILDESSTIVDNIIDHMWNTAVNNSQNIFQYNIGLVNKGARPLGIGKGFELNGLMLLEGLFEKKVVTSKDLQRLGVGNSHFEKMFRKYGFDRNNPVSVYEHLKENGLKSTRDNNLMQKPIDIVFTDGQGFKQMVTLEPNAHKSSQLLKSFMNFVNATGEKKRIIVKGDDVGINVITEGDTSYQLMKFLQGPVGGYILDEVGILKTTTPIIPEQVVRQYNPNVMKKIETAIEARKELKMTPYTEREIKDMVHRATGDEYITEVQLTRSKTPIELLDELKDYYGKPLNYTKGFKYLTSQQKDNKYIFSRLANLLKVGEYNINTYIEGVMDSKILYEGKDVSDKYKILGIRLPFVTVDSEGEAIISGLSKGFISDSKQISGEQANYISDMFTNMEDVSDDGWKALSEGHAVTKLDFDNDSFQVMFNKNGNIVYGSIKKNKKGTFEIIENSIVNKATKLDADVDKIRNARRANPNPSDEIKSWVPNYNKTIDHVADDFKC